MRPRVSLLLLLILTSAAIACAQAQPDSLAASQSAVPSGVASRTYDDTIRMLRAWVNTGRKADMAALFIAGGTRNSDLLTACRSKDTEVESAALSMLQFLGGPGLESCAESLEQRHGGLFLSNPENLTDAEVQEVDRWITAKRARGHPCGDEDDPRIDDALIYALILQGSTRSELVLTNIRALEDFCTGTDMTDHENLDRAQSLIVLARRIGHDLKLEPDISESIRHSAFFLPPKYREHCKVEVLARTEDRILLEASYVCGDLCGRGYYVVLRKDGSVWQYALIRMAWIS